MESDVVFMVFNVLIMVSSMMFMECIMVSSMLYGIYVVLLWYFWYRIC